MSFGELLIARLVDDQDLERWVKYGLTPELFRWDEADLFTEVQAHVKKFGELPKRETLEAKLGIELPHAVEPPDFYRDHVEKRFVYNTLNDRIRHIDKLLKNKKIDEALEVFVQAAIHTKRTLYNQELIDIAKDGWEMICHEYAVQQQGGHQGLHFGWPYLDKVNGGLKGSDVAVFVGRPAMGKTFMLLRCALHMWEQGKVPLFVSLEMEPLELAQRVVAMHAHVPLEPLTKGKLSTPHFTQVKQSPLAAKAPKHPFWISDGGMASSIDNLVMACQLVKPDVLFVDGAYLLDHSDHKAAPWHKVKDNVEDIKRRLGKRLGIPSVLSYQFNKGVTKLKKDQQAGLEHIGLSDAVGQVATIVLGLFEEQSAGTLKRRIEVLKNRRGEIGEFMINWDFNSMNFDQCVEQSLEELILGTHGICETVKASTNHLHV